jgi:hypothetical protein
MEKTLSGLVTINTNGSYNTGFIGAISVSGETTVVGNIDTTMSGTIRGIFDSITISGSLSGTYDHSGIHYELSGDISDTLSGLGYISGEFDGYIYGNVNFLTRGTLSGVLDAVLNGTLDGTLSGVIVDTSGREDLLDAEISGTMSGVLDGDVSGQLEGYISGQVATKYTGYFDGTLSGNLNAIYDGDVSCYLTGDIISTSNLITVSGVVVSDTISASLSGDISGVIDGSSYDGFYSGPSIFDVSGIFTGTISGDFSGSVDGTIYTQYLTNILIQGNLNGTLSGNVSGCIVAEISSNISGTTISISNDHDDIQADFSGTINGIVKEDYTDTSNGTCTKTNIVVVVIGKSSNGGIYDYNVIEPETEYMRRKRRECFVSKSIANNTNQFKSALDLLQVFKYKCNATM